MTVEDIEKIMSMSKLFHVAHIRTGDLEIQFKEDFSEEPRLVAVGGLERARIGEAHGMPTDDELLFASSPSGPPNIAAGIPE